MMLVSGTPHWHLKQLKVKILPLFTVQGPKPHLGSTFKGVIHENLCKRTPCSSLELVKLKEANQDQCLKIYPPPNCNPFFYNKSLVLK